MVHSPRKQPSQARAQVTQAAIVEAAARILETEGQAGLTTNHIARRAGVSIGSLYQYFPDKNAVLAAIVRRERATLAGMVIAVRRTADPETAFARLIDAALAHQFARPRLALALEHAEASLSLEEEAVALAHDLAADTLAVLRFGRPGTSPRQAQDAVAICKGIINAAALAGESDAKDIGRRVTRAVSGYLDGPPGQPRPDLAENHGP